MLLKFIRDRLQEKRQQQNNYYLSDSLSSSSSEESPGSSLSSTKVNKRSNIYKNNDGNQYHSHLARELELCKNVNCNNYQTNGQVSKTWRIAQLTTCCPAYRRMYFQHKKNVAI